MTESDGMMSYEIDIAAAIAQVAETLAAHPERRSDLAEEYILRGETRPYPAFYMWRAPDIDAGEHLTQPLPPATTPEERLLRSLRGMTGSLAMLNPIRPVVNLGKGTGTLPSSFGIMLDPALGFTPKGNRPMREVLAEGMPDPETSGIIPDMRADIEAVQRLTPEWVKIALPDMQGPFNIAHMILGDEVFFAPYEEPEEFAAFLTMVTDFFIALHGRLQSWIEPARRVAFPQNNCRVAECSVNMVSKDIYLEHVLPHDQRIATYYGRIAVHPCSGPHVFSATLDNLPNVVYTEAGYIEKAFAGSIRVADAMEALGGRPIILGIGEELPADWDEAERTVQRYFDYAKTNPRLTFGFTGMYWKKGTEDQIRALHLRLDQYWHDNVWAPHAAVVAG
ncbi:MAG TPA: hypothetical protein VGL77_00215 [Armatimonadota bacterium]